jgi:hypothetical protein
LGSGNSLESSVSGGLFAIEPSRSIPRSRRFETLSLAQSLAT